MSTGGDTSGRPGRGSSAGGGDRPGLGRWRPGVIRGRGPFALLARVDARLTAVVLAGILVFLVSRLNAFWLLVVLSLAVPLLIGSARVPVPNLLSLLVVFSVIPFLTDDFVTYTFFTVGLYVLLGLGLNVVVGLAGLLDLGYVAFFAVGAYTAAFLGSPHFDLHLTYWVIIPAAVVAAAVLGVILGVPVLRLRGDYLAIVTLGFGEIIRLLVNNMDAVTNGPQGIYEIDRPSFAGVDFASGDHLYFLILGGCVLTAFVVDRLRTSRVGRAWEAIREDEDVAAGMGINLVRYKLLAFAIGAGLGGLGGVIFAGSQGAIFPRDFTLFVSINVLALVIIGGMGSIPGVIVGSLILVGAPEGLRELPGTFQELKDYRLVLYGALLVFVMVARPGGIIPSRRRQLEFTAVHRATRAETRDDSAVSPA